MIGWKIEGGSKLITQIELGTLVVFHPGQQWPEVIRLAKQRLLQLLTQW